MQTGYDIRAVQELLSRTDVRTIYTHVSTKGGLGARSPADISRSGISHNPAELRALPPTRQVATLMKVAGRGSVNDLMQCRSASCLQSILRQLIGVMPSQKRSRRIWDIDMHCTRGVTIGLAFVLVGGSACASATAGKLAEVTTDGAPRAAGPYAQGIVANGFLYTAGQLPRDPTTSALVTGDIAAQTNRVLDNLEAILKAAGCSFQDVVKANVFLADLREFAAMNEVFARRFGSHRPARTTVEAKLNAGARIEIDLIARVPR